MLLQEHINAAYRADEIGERHHPAERESMRRTVELIDALDQAEADFEAERSERASLEDILRRLMVGARCLYWHADVEERTTPEGERWLNWDLRIPNPDLVAHWLPIELKPGHTFEQAWCSAVAADDQPAMRSRSMTAFHTGLSGYEQEFRVETAGGGAVWLSETVQIKTLGRGRWRCDAVCTDITDLKRTRERLERQVTIASEARAKLERRRGELAEDNAKLEQLASLDGLTGLRNHRAFLERLTSAFEHSAACGSPLSLIMLDVDRFKLYNDAFGHLAGDEVLKTVARLLQENAREVDCIARYGGEEFAIILPADQETARTVAERLRATIAGASWPRKAVTASFGVATLSPAAPYSTVSALIADADQALYYSKERSRNRVAHAADITRRPVSVKPILAINAGGAAVPHSLFADDAHFDGGEAAGLEFNIQIGGVSSPGPEEIYQSERVGDFTYDIPGLTPRAAYLVRLHFAEIWWDEPGQRLFDVLINDRPVLVEFDIIAQAGGLYQAVVKEFVAIADSEGEIHVAYQSRVDRAKASGIEVLPFPYRNVVSINSAGGKILPFVADRHYQGGAKGGAATYMVDPHFDLSDVDDAIPEIIYGMERWGQFSYKIPDLTPGGSYLVRLHFCEQYWKETGERIFNVVINGETVLADFDVLKEAGKTFKVVAKQIPILADADGNIVLDFIASVDSAQVNAVEVFW